MQRYGQLGLLNFSLRCGILKTFRYPPSINFFSSASNSSFILLYGLRGKPIFLCFYSITFYFSLFCFLFFLSFLLSVFFIWRVSIFPHHHGLRKTFLYFLTPPSPFRHTPNLGFWPNLAIHFKPQINCIIGGGSGKVLGLSRFFQRRVTQKGCLKEFHTLTAIKEVYVKVVLQCIKLRKIISKGFLSKSIKLTRPIIGLFTQGSK